MQISDHIHFIQRGWENANAILITGDKPTLVDSGHAKYASQLPVLIAREGVDVRALAQIVNTHSHWDHTSGNDYLRDLSGATVGMGELTATWMREERRHEMWLSYFGVNPPLTLPDWTFAAGDQLELAGITWEAVALPGHAPDLLGLYQADDKVLISADSLLPNGDCGLINVMVHGWEALDDAIASADQIASMDIKIVLPGHGAPITDVASNVKKLQKRLARFKTQPARLVSHLARRVVMAALLETDPIAERQFRDRVTATEWIRDYAGYLGISAETLYNQTLDPLIQSGAIRNDDGVLIGLVPR